MMAVEDSAGREVSPDRGLVESCPPDADLYVFDFCNTIVAENSTLGFLKFVHRASSLARTLRYYALWIFASVMLRLRLTDGAGYMRVRIASLKGTRCEVLQAQAGQYVDGLQANGLHGGVVDLMEGLIRDGKRVLLVSYTLQWLLEAFNRRHAAERVIGSTLQCDANGICTGRYDVQLQSVGKLRCLRDLYDEALVRNAFLLTDDPQADRDIYDFVAHPVALVVGEGK